MSDTKRRLGSGAVWYCLADAKGRAGCHVKRGLGTRPCSLCCGFTADVSKQYAGRRR